MVRHQAELLRLHQVMSSEAYQDDHVPKGSEAETAGRACIWSASTVTTINLFIPRRLATATEWGHRPKCAALKVLGLFRDGGYVIAFKLSQYAFDV